MKKKNHTWIQIGLCSIAFFLGLALVFPAVGHGQEYPSRPITVLVGMPPGGPADTGARVVGEKLSKALGVPVVIKNQPGAGGAVAVTAAAAAKPDGYTLVWATIGGVSISLATRSDLKYTLDDLTPIAKTIVFPGIIAVREDSPFKSLNELIDFMKKNPGKVKMGSDGVGSSPHMHWSVLESEAGVKPIHIPFKGGGPNTTELLGGHVDFAITVLSSVLSSMEAGKIRGLAFFSPRKSPLFPSVPTTKELGYPESARTAWHGYLAPAGLPRPILDKLEAAARKAVEDPEVAKTLAKFGVEPDYLNADEFKDFLNSELKTYKAIAEKFDLKQ